MTTRTAKYKFKDEQIIDLTRKINAVFENIAMLLSIKVMNFEKYLENDKIINGIK